MYADKNRFFDEQIEAPWAAADYGENEGPKLERLYRHLGPLAGRHILEPGCGTGRLTVDLARRVGPDGHILALDVSPGMAREAVARTKGLINVTIRAASLEDCPLKPESMDIALCHQVLPHIEDKPLALARMAHALRTDGLLVIHHFINSATINDHHRKAGTAVENDLMPEPDAMGALLGAAGFSLDVLLDDDLGYLLTARLVR